MFEKNQKGLSTADKLVFELALYAKYMLLVIRKYLKEVHALFSSKKFICNALSGYSDYNICINADLSVSCNCDDIFGSGQLGRLDVQTFQEVFSGQTAMRFRQQLAKGVLPILECSRCWDLKETSKQNAIYHINNFSLPSRGIMIENIASCNLTCMGCGRKHRPLKSLKMTIGEITKIAHIINESKIKKISFLAQGEPFMSNDILNEVEIIKRINPRIEMSTSTNGMCINTDSKRNAAAKFDLVVFSIDGSSQASAEKYQKGIDFCSAYLNMKNMVKFRTKHNLKKPIIIWKYIVFNWNDKPAHINKAIEMAKDANVDIIQFVYTFTPIYSISWRFLWSRYWRGIAPIDGLDSRRRTVKFADVGHVNEWF